MDLPISSLTGLESTKLENILLLFPHSKATEFKTANLET